MRDHSMTVVGLDVSKSSIAVAVLPPGAERPTENTMIECTPVAIEKLARRLAARGGLEFVYEAGPCGYEVHRQIAGLGHWCSVIAPSLTPVRPGDRVKTDRRDAEKLALYYRAGTLTTIRVPTREEESARDLVRAREDVLGERLRARHHMSKFLLRQGRVFRESKAWGVAHWVWLKSQRFEWEPLRQTFEAYLRAINEADDRLALLDRQLYDLAQHEAYRVPVQYLSALKGIDTLGGLTLVVEAQEFARFQRARGFMGYTGMVPSEWSTGGPGKERRGSITKAGNAHIRRILVEAAWSYRHAGARSADIVRRRKGCPPAVVRIAKQAQDRLHRKYWRLVSKGKAHQVAVVAVARELAGFVWSLARLFPAPAAA